MQLPRLPKLRNCLRLVLVLILVLLTMLKPKFQWQKMLHQIRAWRSTKAIIVRFALIQHRQTYLTVIFATLVVMVFVPDSSMKWLAGYCIIIKFTGWVMCADCRKSSSQKIKQLQTALTVVSEVMSTVNKLQQKLANVDISISHSQVDSINIDNTNVTKQQRLILQCRYTEHWLMFPSKGKML